MDGSPLPRDTRQAILDAAEATAAEIGVRNLTLDEIARRAGLSKGGIFYHFGDKETLIAAMVDRFTRRFDAAWSGTIAADPEPRGRKTRAYVETSLGHGPNVGEAFDHACGSLTAAISNLPEKLETVREQSARSQAAVEADGLDPIFATILRLATDGMWLAESFNLARYDPALRAAVVERMIAWSRLEQLPSAARLGGPDPDAAPDTKSQTKPKTIRKKG